MLNPTVFFNPYRNSIPNGQVFIRSQSNLNEWLYIEIQAEIKSTIFTNVAHDDDSYHYLWDQHLGSYSEKVCDDLIPLNPSMGI